MAGIFLLIEWYTNGGMRTRKDKKEKTAKIIPVGSVSYAICAMRCVVFSKIHHVENLDLKYIESVSGLFATSYLGQLPA